MQALLTYTDLFGVTTGHAKAILREVTDSMTGWRLAARRNGIPETEIHRFEPTLERTVAVLADAASSAT